MIKRSECRPTIMSRLSWQSTSSGGGGGGHHWIPRAPGGGGGIYFLSQQTFLSISKNETRISPLVGTF